MLKNKGLIIFLIILLSVIAIALILLMCFLLSGKTNFMLGHNISNELVIDEVYDVEFSNININTDAAKVEVRSGNENEIRLKIYGKKENINLSADNGYLDIKINSEKKTGFNFFTKIAKVELYLPESYDKEISIENKYGDIEIGKLLNSNMNVEDDCGDIDIKGANNITVKNKYGDIKIGEVKDANITADAGDIKLEKADNLIIENKYGDISIENIFNSLKAVDNCGDIKINNLDIKENSDIQNDFGNIKINKTNEVFIDAKTDLGDTKIKNNFQKSDVVLKINNNCGDIKVGD